jgi:stage II sporulation protein D
MRWRRGALAAALVLAIGGAHAQSPAPAGAAFFVRGLDNPRERREARPDILDTPVHPGSIVKAIALVAALETGVVAAGADHMCRRVVTADGHKFVCAHPDLKRALSPAEALAYSCNDFFVSLAPRLSRAALNRTRLAAGLPPLASGTSMAKAIVGLDGPRTTPRALIDMLARLAAAGKDTPVAMRAETRMVLLQGLRGAAEFGTAAALGAAGVSSLAKTGSILMPAGGALGLVVALTPADRPTRGIVVVAPGAAGVDAAGIAADLLGASNAGAEVVRTPVVAAASRVSPGKPLPPVRLGRTLAGGRTRVESIAMDDYIAQVLAGEGQPRAGDAAQEALAITARTFAVANRNRHRREGFDLCDTTHCQVVRTPTAVTRRAAAATSGRLLLHQGQPAFVFYSASCGGRSEQASEVWPGAVDYGQGPAIEDDACTHEPPWQGEVRAADLERALRAAGLRGSRLRELRVIARNASGRVSRLRADGFTPAEVSGHEFRMAVGRIAGWQSIKSTAFDVDRTSTGYRFRGRGFGHGVGLCVIGAGGRAARGASADDILKFYYPGLSVGGAGAPQITAAPPPGPRSPAAAAVDIALALPGSEEGERAAVLSVLRKSRDEVAKATGVVPPPRIRVTVHPTVESFGRATGQPWWVSGATDGSSVDLLPIAMLKRQGQLERTLRHEIAHVLLDPALAKRPMWVREGAAAYFSGPGLAPGEKPPRVTCPRDVELLRPVSAGAQREAYGRAETCFARAIAEGKSWERVR